MHTDGTMTLLSEFQMESSYWINDALAQDVGLFEVGGSDRASKVTGLMADRMFDQRDMLGGAYVEWEGRQATRKADIAHWVTVGLAALSPILGSTLGRLEASLYVSGALLLIGVTTGHYWASWLARLEITRTRHGITSFLQLTQPYLLEQDLHAYGDLWVAALCRVQDFVEEFSSNLRK